MINKSQLGVVIWQRVSLGPGEQQENEKWRTDFR